MSILLGRAVAGSNIYETARPEKIFNIFTRFYSVTNIAPHNIPMIVAWSYKKTKLCERQLYLVKIP